MKRTQMSLRSRTNGGFIALLSALGYLAIPLGVWAACSDCYDGYTWTAGVATNCPTCAPTTGVGDCYYSGTPFNCQTWNISTPGTRVTVSGQPCHFLSECNGD